MSSYLVIQNIGLIKSPLNYVLKWVSEALVFEYTYRSQWNKRWRKRSQRSKTRSIQKAADTTNNQPFHGHQHWIHQHKVLKTTCLNFKNHSKALMNNCKSISNNVEVSYKHGGLYLAMDTHNMEKSITTTPYAPDNLEIRVKIFVWEINYRGKKYKKRKRKDMTFKDNNRKNHSLMLT